MPILNVQFAGEGQTPDGRMVPVPPHEILVQRGPCVQVTISVAQPIAELLVQQGLPVPDPITGFGMVDSGASVTCIDDATAQQLQLPVVDVVTMTSASHASTQQNVYPARIEIIGSGITIDASRAMGANLTPQGIILLIGRDVLANCVYIHNGPLGQFTLTL